jgi:ABC-type lipoprotein release transport system permease subunit
MSSALKLGWRNIWRNRRRTLLSMSAIGVGLFLVTFYSGLIGGMLGNAANELDNAGMGHVEISAPGYRPRHEVGLTIPELSTFKDKLTLPPGAEIGDRVLARGLATSARGSEAVQVFGVDFDSEKLLSAHVRDVRQGALPAADDAKGILVGEELAARLNLKLGAKVRLMLQRSDNEMGADLFRVRGIFHSIAPSIGQRQVYVSQAAARELLGLGEVSHQVVIQLPDAELADKVAAQARAALGPQFEVVTWADLLPILKKMEALTRNASLIMSFFVYLLVGLGVLNTMLMSVLERTREFGVLLSLGTRPSRILSIVLSESFWIATLSAAGGALLGAWVTWHFSHTGMNMGTGGESIQLQGSVIATTVKTKFNPADILKASTFVYVMALVVGLYPASRITRLQPAEALRRT